MDGVVAPKVRVGQVWVCSQPGTPSLQVLSLSPDGRKVHCQVIDRDRTVDVSVKRLRAGLTGYELQPKKPKPIDAPCAPAEEATT